MKIITTIGSNVYDGRVGTPNGKPLRPNFTVQPKTVTGKATKHVPKKLDYHDPSDPHKTKRSKPTFDPTTRKYSDDDYTKPHRDPKAVKLKSINVQGLAVDSRPQSRVRRGKGVEVRGGFSSMYTNALLEVFQKKNLLPNRTKGRERFYAPMEVLRAARQGPLKMVVRVKTIEHLDDLKLWATEATEDLATAEEVIYSVSGIDVAAAAAKPDDLAAAAAAAGIRIIVGCEALVDTLEREL